MFARKKSSVNITPDSPVFYVRYVGSTETFIASGKGCTQAPVQSIWDNAQDESEMRRVSVTISPSGLCVRDLEKKDDGGIKFPIEDISYCNADSDINTKIFSWISKCTDNNKIKCHVVLCSSLEKARAMALVLSRAFHIAYKEWKADKKRIERKKSSSSTNTRGSEKTDRPGKSNCKYPAGQGNVRKNCGDNPGGDRIEARRENLNITHDEDSLDSEQRDNDDTLSENNAIIDPTNLRSYRLDEGVKAVLNGDGPTRYPSPPPPNNQTTPPMNSPGGPGPRIEQPSGGLVMV